MSDHLLSHTCSTDAKGRIFQVLNFTLDFLVIRLFDKERGQRASD